MANIYLLHYNNYYNRKLYIEQNIQAYTKYLVKSTNQVDGNFDSNGNENVIRNTNFIEKDMVNTELVANWVGQIPNYIICTDDDDTRIDSRWFITGYSKENFAQYSFQLHRDLIADHYSTISNQPIFIEKAKPIDINDPAIFNNEDMSFNQIKAAEYQLKDKTGVPWIVGYIPKNYNGGSITANYTIKGAAYQSFTPGQFNQWKFYNFVKPSTGLNDKGVSTCYAISSAKAALYYSGFYDTRLVYLVGNKQRYRDFTYTVTIGETNNPSQKYSYNYNITVDKTYDQTRWGNPSSYNYKSSTYTYTWTNTAVGPYTSEDNLSKAFAGILTTDFINLCNSCSVAHLSNNDFTELKNYDGKVIYIGDNTTGKYYRVNLIYGTSAPRNVSLSSNTGFLSQQGQFQYCNVYNSGSYITGYETPPAPYNVVNAQRPFDPWVDFKTVIIDLQEIKQELGCTIPNTVNRFHIPDQQYDMFCIPYMDMFTGKRLKVMNGTATEIAECDSLAGLTIATEITLDEGQANLFDLQLLPYCPIREIVQDGYIDVKNYTYAPIKTIIDGQETGDPLSLMIFGNKSDFSFVLDFEIPVGSTVEEKKVKSLTEMWRLSSPNYNGVFEFNPQMNNGVIGFNVDCNYKPFSSYIHINPIFSGLYGYDNFRDSRGLICGGDFSLPMATDAWTEYKYSNKNYQEMFDRGIENMQVNNAVQQEKEKWQMAANVMQAYAQGKQYAQGQFGGKLGDILTGGLRSKAYGAAAAGFSYAAGKRDIELNNQIRQEGIDYQRDMFGYQLGNIQALSNSLTNVGSFTYNNKYFPFLEKYVCDLPGSTIQTNALKNKLKYNGYTIMRVGYLNNFIQEEETYFKGQLVRLSDEFMEDYHIANALYEELKLGVFLSINASKSREEQEETEETE